MRVTDVLVAEGDGIDGETSDVEAVMGTAEMVGGEVNGEVEVEVKEAGGGEVADENGEANGGVWMDEVVGASAVVATTVGGPFLFPTGPGGPFLLFC